MSDTKKKIRESIYEILEKPEDNGKKNKKYTVFNTALTVLICLNIIAVFVASFDEIYVKYKQLFNYFEYFSIAVFTIEYLLRIWTAFGQSTKSKTPYIFSFYGLTDLLAILPFYLPFIFGIDLRILRVFRLFRVVKLFRYNNSFDLIAKVLKNEKDKLVATVFIMIILILFASSMMYLFENKAQPDTFPNIPTTLWWAVATLTTVGYGDTYPITVLGKLLGGIIAILGIGLVAMPSGIIAMGLIEEVRSQSADPEDVHKFLNTLEKYVGNIGKAFETAKGELNKGEHYDFSSRKKENSYKEGYGVLFLEKKNPRGDLFIGLSPKVFDMRDGKKDGKDFVYSLAIEKKAIRYKSIDEEKYPYLIGNDEWIYIQIVDRNIFTDEKSVDKLSEKIVDIITNVYLKNCFS
jgi:voltage-gated potassium channel